MSVSLPTHAHAPRPIHHAVVFENRPFSAIPFGQSGPAYALAKRATGEGNPARSVEVYAHDGKHYDYEGGVVVMRGEK